MVGTVGVRPVPRRISTLLWEQCWRMASILRSAKRSLNKRRTNHENSLTTTADERGIMPLQ